MGTSLATIKHSGVSAALVQIRHETGWQTRTLGREQTNCSEDTLLDYCSIFKHPHRLAGPSISTPSFG
jgi:hypothetical protein